MSLIPPFGRLPGRDAGEPRGKRPTIFSDRGEHLRFPAPQHETLGAEDGVTSPNPKIVATRGQAENKRPRGRVLEVVGKAGDVHLDVGLQAVHDHRPTGAG